MNTKIALKETFTIPSQYIKDFSNDFNILIKNLKVDPNIFKINETDKPNMRKGTRGSWVSVINADITWPGLIADNSFLFIGLFLGAADKVSAHKLTILPGYKDDLNIKRKELRRDVSYFLFQNTKNLSIVKYNPVEVKRNFGEDFLREILLEVSVISDNEKRFKNKELKRYSVFNIYSATKFLTKNWTIWQKGISSDQIFKAITKGECPPILVSEAITSLKEVRDDSKGSKNALVEDTYNAICSGNLNNLNYFYSKTFVGLLAYAFYAQKSKKKVIPIKKNIGQFISEAEGTPIEVCGQLFYKETKYNDYNTEVNCYILEGFDHNYYSINTAVKVPELISGQEVTVTCQVIGKVGSRWTPRSGEYKGVNINNIKGRIKINKL